MLQDTDLFDKLPGVLELGDVHPTIKWEESPSPDERYTVGVTWKYQNTQVGTATFIIEPIVGTKFYRVFWVHLAFIDSYQQQGLYTDIVGRFPAFMLDYLIVETVAIPWDAESERRLASQGFKWVGSAFVLDHTAAAS